MGQQEKHRKKKPGAIVAIAIVAIALAAACFLCVAASALSPDAPGEKQAIPTPQTVLVNGAVSEIEGYNIDGYNYFKLRDLAAAVGSFAVDYDEATDTVLITTGEGAGGSGGAAVTTTSPAKQTTTAPKQTTAPTTQPATSAQSATTVTQSGGGSGGGSSGGSGGGSGSGSGSQGTQPATQPVSQSAPSDALKNAFALQAPIKAAANGNYLFSPLSIRAAFLMAANGAEGVTQKEILSAFSVTDLAAANSAIAAQIKAAEAFSGASSKPAEYGYQPATLDIANSIWYNTDIYPVAANGAEDGFSDAFVATMKSAFSAQAGDVTRATIVPTVNDWIAQKTNNKIQQALQDTEANRNNLLVLANTVYFKASWLDPFATGVGKMTFTGASGKSSQVDFMASEKSTAYYEDANLQMAKFPYYIDGANISMAVFLPREGKALTAAAAQTALDNAQSKVVHAELPKFTTDFDCDLTPVAKSLGINDAFSPQCMGFRDVIAKNVPAGEPVYISSAIHKTFISVDEKGTEAAAATVIGMAGTAMPDPTQPPRFICDRPFAYLIVDDRSGEVYFFGEYNTAA